MLKDDCIFCDIIQGKLPSKKVYENERVYAFEDIKPAAPIHVLIVPKTHIATINDIRNEDQEYLSAMLLAAKEVAKILNIEENGYRLVFNTNSDACQTVFHIHLHLIAGRKFAWPPG
jgi:histidine triad (HIT) family protein